MKFVDHGLTEAHYRWKFLQYTDQIAPEVLQTLKLLCPKYDEVINGYSITDWLTWWLTDEVDCPDETEILAHLAVEYRYKSEKQNDPRLVNQTALENFFSLKKGYSDFIEQFGLETVWLRRDLFRLLGDLTYKPKYFNSLVLAYLHAYFPGHGDQFEFTFDGWKIELDSEDYETAVREAFENELRQYVNRTKSQFKKGKYKEATKPRAIDNVKWLVYWTVKRIEKEEILQMILSEAFEKEKEGIDLKTLEFHFRTFKKNGLPVR